MRKFVITTIVLFVLGICAVVGYKAIGSTNMAYDTLLFFGGILLGAGSVFATLVWSGRHNPAIITEIDRLDEREATK
jgi:hypothetical protein